ncbi:uncharacterized protein [Lolium perenne]|uniref:uncharacterized protein isoform X1 n=1 Tax=Lolium perenne TaxID=4522 RepID=UPI0021F5D8BB|nr:uncharacterized protein LOC127294531 isoform X1 [Lolium perenne]
MATWLPTLFGHICLLEIRVPSGFAVEDDFSAAEQSIFYGGVEIHDRHRDMRLDIANRSYEEKPPYVTKVEKLCSSSTKWMDVIAYGGSFLGLVLVSSHLLRCDAGRNGAHGEKSGMLPCRWWTEEVLMM